MKTAIVSAIVIVAAISANSFAQGTATSPNYTPKIQANTGKVVTAMPKLKKHFLKKNELQEKEQTAKKSGS